MNNPIYREKVKKSLAKLAKSGRYSELAFYEKELGEKQLKLASETEIQKRLNTLRIKKMSDYLALIECTNFTNDEHLLFLAKNNDK